MNRLLIVGRRVWAHWSQAKRHGPVNINNRLNSQLINLFIKRFTNYEIVGWCMMKFYRLPTLPPASPILDYSMIGWPDSMIR